MLFTNLHFFKNEFLKLSYFIVKIYCFKFFIKVYFKILSVKFFFLKKFSQQVMGTFFFVSVL